MVISFTPDKIVLELSREEFESLAPEAIESGVLSELRKMLAVKQYSKGEITDTPISLEAFLADQTGKYSVIARSAATKQSPPGRRRLLRFARNDRS